MPETGTFLTRDPWEGFAYMPTTMNRYNYANQAPVNFTDPTSFAPLARGGNPITEAMEECLEMKPCRDLVFVVAEERGTTTAT